MKPPKNVAASVRQRLLNKARDENRPFNELLQYFAMERFLYRLSQSDLVDSFILKGALMLRVWRSPELRPTMDIDMLGRTTNDEVQVISQIQNILSVDVENDGLVFDPHSILAEQITEDADYEGIRIRFLGSLGVARINMQIDIGYGDIVYPEPEKSDLPTILDFPAPSLFCYSRESSIAEKLEAMVKLGALNSRMKDFYDIWLLSRQFNFDGEKLAEAIRLTFERRETSVPMALDVFNDPFVEAKQVQWTAFRRRLKQDKVPDAFAEVAASIERFLFPIVSGLSSNLRKPTHWIAPGPWD